MDAHDVSNTALAGCAGHANVRSGLYGHQPDDRPQYSTRSKHSAGGFWHAGWLAEWLAEHIGLPVGQPR